MLRKVILKTEGMFNDIDPQDRDYKLWKSIEEYMDGETAFVIASQVSEGEYIFLGLEDKEKEKELFYMMEQDSMVGIFVNDKEGFDRAWESGEYEPAAGLYLEKKYLEFIKLGFRGGRVKMEIQPREAIDIIKRMYKGTPTTDQLIALEMAYEALEKQQPLSRIVIEGRYFCPKCKNLMRYPGYCGCGQRVY